jgi:hypothetical protein
MHAEIDRAAASRQRRIVEPGLVGAIGVVEGEIDANTRPAHPSAPARRSPACPRCADRRGRRRAAGLPHAPRRSRRYLTGGPPERLLAKHRRPARSARTVCSACIALGVAMTMPSRPRSSMSGRSGTTRASGASFVASRSALGDGSQIAAASTAPVASIASMRCRPIQPVPRKPIRGFMRQHHTTSSPAP